MKTKRKGQGLPKQTGVIVPRIIAEFYKYAQVIFKQRKKSVLQESNTSIALETVVSTISCA